MRTDAGVSSVHRDASSSHVNAHDPGYGASSAGLVVPDVRHDVPNANTVKPDVQVQGNLANTRTFSSHIHPSVSKNKKVNVQNRAVCTPRDPPVPG